MISDVRDFVSQKRIALVGISQKGNKFGNIAFKELRKKDYELFLIHPTAKEMDGFPCYPNLRSLPEQTDGVLISVHPDKTEDVVKDALEAGIKRIWMQQGSESEQAIKYCEDHGLSVVHGECILMFAEPVAFLHRLHRGIWKLLGKYPK
jgi:predicted CoA-binding protein